MEEKKQGEILYGQEQIDAIREEMKSEENADRVVAEINSPTPIFAVYFVTKAGKKVHFANFYGTTIDYPVVLTQEKLEAEVQKNDGKTFAMIEELENKIKAGDFKKVKPDLYVEVNWGKFGGFMHKMMGAMEDALSCKTIERAFELFQREYVNVGKTEKQILDEKLESFKESLNADVWDDLLD